MNTLFLLMAEFNGRAAVDIAEIGPKYLGITDKAKLSAKARTGQLPFPAFRAETSQKAPWLVNITDLAEYLDRERDKAKQDWQQIHA